MSKTITKPKKFDGCEVPWCTVPFEHHPDDCSGDVHNVHGANLGTRLGLWISCDQGDQDRPAACLALTGRRDKPIDSIDLEVDELRDLAYVCRTLADQLEADLPRVLGRAS